MFPKMVLEHHFFKGGILMCANEKNSFSGVLRPSVFNRYITNHDTKLVFNSCSCSLICLEEEKLTALRQGKLDSFSEDELTLLKKMNFINSITNEKEYVVKDHYESRASDKVLNLTIFTTTLCNARCAYCFEKNVERSTPNEEKIDDIIDFILKQRKESVHMKWFGGEPLMNTKIINRVTSELKNNGIDFDCSMITNGYLILRNLDHIKNWNIKCIQITLDGINEKYNMVKNYIYKNDPNPFMTVINGIKGLLSIGVKVSVRLNFDKYNYKDILECIDYLNAEIGHPENFKIYCHNIFGPSGVYHLNDGTNLYELVVGKLIECGYINTIFRLGLRYRPVPCAAYNPNFFVIDTYGHLLKCEHCVSEKLCKNIVGNINNGITNRRNFNYWLDRKLPYNKCQLCEFLPLCQGGCKFEVLEDYDNSACLPYRDCIDELLYKYYLFKTEKDNRG